MTNKTTPNAANAEAIPNTEAPTGVSSDVTLATMPTIATNMMKLLRTMCILPMSTVELPKHPHATRSPLASTLNIATVNAPIKRTARHNPTADQS